MSVWEGVGTGLHVWGRVGARFGGGYKGYLKLEKGNNLRYLYEGWCDL